MDAGMAAMAVEADMVDTALAKTMVATLEVMAAMEAMEVIAMAVMVTAFTTVVLATNG
jgi:hypothetical protein